MDIRVGAMPKVKKKSRATIPDALVNEVKARLEQSKTVSRPLPVWGRLHIERPLPFLCVYRQPPDHADNETERLIKSEAAYLLALGNSQTDKSLAPLIEGIIETLSPICGSFVILEIWTRHVPGDTKGRGDTLQRPSFRIIAPDLEEIASTVEALERALSGIKLQGLRATAETSYRGSTRPPGRQPLLPHSKMEQHNAHLIGLEISPTFRNAKTGEIYPEILRNLQHQLSRALKVAFFRFAQSQTKYFPLHYQALGKRAFVKAAWEVDKKLAEVSNSYDFLLALTPVNGSQAWAQFKRRKFEKRPSFTYRPLKVDPGLLKRELYAVPIEEIIDPVLSHLFREKQEEMDRQISMLSDRHRPQFLHGSMQVFGGVTNKTFSLAVQLLEKISPRSRDGSAGGTLDCKAFAKLAQAEIDFFRQTFPELKSKVKIRSDVNGLMVSRGSVLIGKDVQIPARRANALIQHEIGTHVLTYVNGKAQPFKQLYTGLAGYEELQEGLAVLAEYLAGGLTKPRLRVLAGRVIAVRRLTEGASFVETFRELHGEYEFSERVAFNIVMRVYRGGGLTKDSIYLAGLVNLLKYLEEGGLLDPLFIGKINLEHVKLIEELQWRKIVTPPLLMPRYLDDSKSIDRLKHLRSGVSVIDLVGRN